MGVAMVRRGLVWGTGAALFASAAQAHGFGQRYDLPIPLSVGNVWRVLNPWDTLFTAAEAIHGRLQPRKSLSLQCPYPALLDRWPAFFLFVMFAWMELVWSGRDVPAQLATAILLYSAWSWLGMLAVGRETWLARADMF